MLEAVKFLIWNSVDARNGLYLVHGNGEEIIVKLRGTARIGAPCWQRLAMSRCGTEEQSVRFFPRAEHPEEDEKP